MFRTHQKAGPLSQAVFLLFLSAHVLPADNVTWTGAVDTDWENGANWDNNAGPSEGDRAYLNAGSLVDYNVDAGIEEVPNYRGVIQSGGTLNILGGKLDALELASATSDFSGIVNQTGGEVIYNAMKVGDASGTNGQYNLSGGELRVARGNGGYSLRLGGMSTGNGSLTISGGSFLTRDSVKLGDATNTGLGEFVVEGSGASQIGLGAANEDIDATWEQYAGSTLKVLVDGGGCAPIVIHDNSNTTGTSATFESGALLDVGFVGGGTAGVGGTWTVLEVENGSITDNGLAFASGVDTSVWSFAIDNSGSNGVLTITSNYTIPDLNVTWDGSENTAWEDPLNWSNDFGVFDQAYAHVSTGIIDYTGASERDLNIRGFRMTGGTLNIHGGTLKATARSSDHSDLDGTTNHTGGVAEINALQIGGSSGSNAAYYLSGGELRIARASGGSSLFLGANRSNANAGHGSLIVSGGLIVTRTGVDLGDATASGTGHFAVLGAGASEINIAGGNDDSDGFWRQHSGSTLEVGIDFEGVTPIFITDSETNTTGTSATFEAGSLLDVDYYNITEGGGSWVVMEVENGPIIDNGLSFAPGVDTSIWSFTVDNSGSNGRLIVSAVGDPIGLDITIGNTLQQKMRYGMDYERLWYWSGNLSGSERNDVARWSAVDTDIDFVRVAMNSGYELNEGVFDLSAYTSKIIPLMQEMQEANPDIKFFASPRPLNESYSSSNPEFSGLSKSDIRWQPYPLWVTDVSVTTSDPRSYTSSSFDFGWEKCAEYIVKYLILMKSYGFQISFLDITNEWQSNVGGGRVTQDDMDHIHEYLNETYLASPWEHPDYPGITLTAEDIPEIVAPSSWNYSQGGQWIDNLDSGDKEAISIAASHNTDRTGSAVNFANSVYNALGSDTEIWNTEVHGWKSTSNENETTSFRYYLETIRAGFGGINGWLAIGTTNQGHSYILNPNGTPVRNVKYYIYRKLSSTSNYGHALNILNEPSASVFADTSDDYDSARNVAAFIKGNLMTVWVINEHDSTVPVVITPSGHTIAESNVRLTRWTDPSDVEGFESLIPVTSNTSFGTTIPGESVCCFEIVLDPEDFSHDRIEAEDASHQWGTYTQTAGDVDGNENVGNISNGDFLRFGSVALEDDSTLAFRVARPAGRPEGKIQVREGSADGRVLGEVSVPETGHWQVYETIETTLDVDAGIYNLYLYFVEEGTSTDNAFVNLNWFSVNVPEFDDSISGLTATAAGWDQIDLSWDETVGATGYVVRRATSPGGPYTTLFSNYGGTSLSDSGLDALTTYYYLVNAKTSEGTGPDSVEVSATTEAPLVSGLTATTAGPDEITLSWNAASGATGYVVRRATSSGGPYTTLYSNYTGTSLSDTGLEPFTTYYYLVNAKAAGGTGPDSGEVLATTGAEPIVPENLLVESFEFGYDEMSNEQLSFTIEQTGVGQKYQIEKSTSLEAGDWETLGPVFSGNGGQLVIDVPFDYSDPNNVVQFFRVRVWID